MMNYSACDFFSPSLQLLAMIGEQFDHGDEICGAVVNVRSRQEKISIWTKNASNEAAQVIAVKMNLPFLNLISLGKLGRCLMTHIFLLQLSIGKQWKEFLDYNDTIGFIFHVRI